MLNLEFRGRDFTGENYKGQGLEGRDYRRSKLINVDFSNANLKNCIFIRADLTGANFQSADITDANFEKALNIDKANFLGAFWRDRIVTQQPEVIEDKYFILITDVFIQIGCLQATREEWAAKTDEEIKELGKIRANCTEEENNKDAEDALVWWRDNKDFLLKK